MGAETMQGKSDGIAGWERKLDPHYHFVPRSNDVEIREVPGGASEIGQYVRLLEVEDIKDLLRDGVRRLVEYDMAGGLRLIPPSECFEYWKWARPHLVQDGKPYLEDYPGSFFLAPYEWRGHDGERMIVFARYH
ncbi:hypothetical protein [Rhizobium sp.]